MITQSQLKEFLIYDPEAGVFTWKVAPARGKTKAGDVAGSIIVNKIGKKYCYIGLLGKNYMAHRLVFLYMTGAFPKEDVDHIDGEGSNNKWSNLRAVSHLENMKNIKLLPRNTSGVCGVTWDSAKSNWQAKITIGYKTIYLGRFKNIEEATQKRKEAEIKYGFHKNHGKVLRSA